MVKVMPACVKAPGPTPAAGALNAVPLGRDEPSLEKALGPRSRPDPAVLGLSLAAA